MFMPSKLKRAQSQRSLIKKKITFEEGCEVKRVPLDKHLLDKVVTISATLSDKEKKLLDFLNKNKDVFA